MRIAVFDVQEYEIPFFAAIENQYDLMMTEKNLTQETMHMLEGCQGISISIHSIMKGPILEAVKARGISLLCTRTIGYDHIDVDYAKELGIQVSNVHYEPNGVAEYTVMLMLLCLRKFKAATMRGGVLDFSLTGLIGRELRNMTVGILGTGGIGSAVIDLLAGFGCRIIAHDPYPNPDLAGRVEYLRLDDIYAQADILSLHLPMLDGMYHMINDDSIAKMKPGVILVNTSRGGLLDAEALIRGIESKHIGALGLDVFEDEQGIYHSDLRLEILNYRSMAYLRQFSNVIMTHHIAFLTDNDVNAMVTQSIEKLCAQYEGRSNSSL